MESFCYVCFLHICCFSHGFASSVFNPNDMKCLLYRLDIITLLSVISKIVLSNCTSPLVTDEFLTAVDLHCQPCVLTYCVSTLRHTKENKATGKLRRVETEQARQISSPGALQAWLKAYVLSLAMAVLYCGVTKRLGSTCSLLGVVDEAREAEQVFFLFCFPLFSS